MQIIFQKKVVRGKDVTLTGKKGAGDLTSVLTGATSSGEPASASTLSTCQALWTDLAPPLASSCGQTQGSTPQSVGINQQAKLLCSTQHSCPIFLPISFWKDLVP